MKLTQEQFAALVGLMCLASLSGEQEKQLKALTGMAEAFGQMDEVNAEVAAAKEKAENEAKAKASEGAKSPGFLDNAKAAVADKAKLMSANAELTKSNGELKASNVQLTGQVTALQAELAAVKQERDKAAKELAETKAKVTTVSEGVTAEISSIGVAPKNLPAAQTAENAGAPQTEEALNAAMKGKPFAERAQMRREFEARQAAAKKAGQN